ncbi:MAG: RES family NAD+ phosphorylase [Candidatus Dormibacteria bacterium]
MIPAGGPPLGRRPARGTASPGGPVDLVVYRGISGMRPLWWTPNLGWGRWHGPAQPRPVQYLSTHPMGPLAEQARHAGTHTAIELRQLRRHVFALRVRLARVVELDFQAAAAGGLEPEALVGPPSSYPACSRWLGELIDRFPEIEGLLVPCAALPGVRTLVVIGKRHPFPYLATPRRDVDVPCAAVGLDAHAVTSLAGRIMPLESTDHPGLLAWREGRPYPFVQPRAVA